MAHRSLDRLDKKILHLISEDARIPFLEVARACNVSGAAIHQRIQKLTNLGVIKGSQFIIDPERIGYETCAFIGLNLKNPEKFDDVVEALRQIPEIVECHYTTGEYDLFLKIYAYNNHSPYVCHSRQADATWSITQREFKCSYQCCYRSHLTYRGYEGC